MLAVFTGSPLLVFNFSVKFKHSGSHMSLGAENLDLDFHPPCNLLLLKYVSRGQPQIPTQSSKVIDRLPTLEGL